MAEEFDVWRLVAGLGLFLFGMHVLEQSLNALAGRSFKRFLRRETGAPWRGVLAGAIGTAALQSSSVVSLIVLAFVGAGIISLASAIGIVFGSNLGTTATGWIVATMGFRLDIESLALPLVAIGGFCVVWLRSATKRHAVGQLMVGLGLMLMGLDFMKSGVVAAAGLFDPGALAAYPPIVFLVAGLVLTAVIQSSSATIMITLSALYADAIPLPAAAAVAIGADLGTTVTAVLGSLAGSTDKRRVALAIVIFNVVTDTIAFIFMQPLLALITDVAGIHDPLFALVAFHSLFNLVGIALFLPLVGLLSRWLKQRFAGRQVPLLRHINVDAEAVPEAAISNISAETRRLIDQVAALNQLGFSLPARHSFYDDASDREAVRLFGPNPDFDAGYAAVKQLEGEILAVALALQREPLEPEESSRLGQIVPALRNAVHAAKSIRDIRHDLFAFRDAVDDRFHAYHARFRDGAREFYAAMTGLANAGLATLRFEALVELKNTGERVHARIHRQIYDEIAHGELSRVQVSTLLNVNRELLASNRGITAALADLLLDADSADDFASLPLAG